MPQTTAPTSPAIITNPDELARLVQDCTKTRTPIIDYGIAHTGLGNPPPINRIKLQLRDTTVEHHERDFVVSAATGITMGQLQTALSQANQFVPIDADTDLTLGEVILHHVYGPLRVGYGSVRDLLLGLRYIDGLGRDIHAGGRTVKNVAGYDLTRFMVGSLGELGLVYNATLRTSAIPPSVLTVNVQFSSPKQIDSVMTNLLVADTAPAEASLHIDTTNSDATLTLAYHGHSDDCQAQLDALKDFVTHVGAMRIVDTQRRTWDQHHQEKSHGRQWRRHTPTLVKIILPPAHTSAACETLSQWAREKNTPLRIDALPAHGCIFVGGDLNAETAYRLDQVIGRIITLVNGLRAWHARPPGLTGAQSIVPFAPTQPDWPLLTLLKNQLDPLGLLNPGRFLPVQRPA